MVVENGIAISYKPLGLALHKIGLTCENKGIRNSFASRVLFG